MRFAHMIDRPRYQTTGLALDLREQIRSITTSPAPEQPA